MIALLAGWLAVAVVIVWSGWFAFAAPLMVAGTIWALTGAVLIVGWNVRVFRRWWTTVDLRGLIALHLTRFIGVYFLFLTGRGELPAAFAKSAGWGDIIVASIAALLLRGATIRKTFALAWNTGA